MLLDRCTSYKARGYSMRVLLVAVCIFLATIYSYHFLNPLQQDSIEELPEPVIKHWWANTTQDAEGLEHMESTMSDHVSFHI
jgi:hypothetical protein